MSTQRTAFRNLETEAIKVAEREITLADGSIVPLAMALLIISDVFYFAPELEGQGSAASFAAGGVRHACQAFFAAKNAHLSGFKENHGDDFEVALRSLGFLKTDLTYLSKYQDKEGLREETLQLSRNTAMDDYQVNKAGPENDKKLADWLTVLKSPKNLQSAIQGVLTELNTNKSRLISYAQDAYNKAYAATTRQP